ncbi:ABC transporter ATP-binding protein [Roseomonas sp. 18066]|uniref:ABC transporter ATP-binding protein n=1 Tax=Roseomonas sp. 18066 TaxID=2681412 RepID=UPI001356CC95|nr:ABC transporter ATP-binding protein [Roseomonas sp. 18066]
MTTKDTTAPLLEIRDLAVHFPTPGGAVRAVNGVSYTLRAGETLGIVGESGSGKSVHVLALLGLLAARGGAGAIVSGSVRFEGQELIGRDEPALRALRGRRIGVVFQDPMSSLNPVLTVGEQIAEALTSHGLGRAAATRRALELLELVGIREPQRRARDYPHQFSGGMRQRVMIAIGIACEPKLLIADEPTTALDVTVQAQVLDLMRDLRKKLGMAMIWITHDMGVVAGIAETVQVMYGGRILERGPVRAVFHDTRNAYTLGLLQSLPGAAGAAHRSRLTSIPGQPPDMTRPPPGDPFAPRNRFATPRCFEEVPPLAQVPDGAPGHLVAAWYDLRAALAAEAAA